MTGNEEQLFRAAWPLIDLANTVKGLNYVPPPSAEDLRKLRLQAHAALAEWDHLRGDIGSPEKSENKK